MIPDKFSRFRRLVYIYLYNYFISMIGLLLVSLINMRDSLDLYQGVNAVALFCARSAEIDGQSDCDQMAYYLPYMPMSG